ncbi:helix-turn-helix domain-containing protein [Microbacteriaceae bacterium VKM Ac-2855]|nr:helix-turn-helix domain-containing protein [Microbacteriaceae bacterium VKM Ac-2855]
MKYTGEIDSADKIGLMLQQGRSLRGVSQRELAKELGISQRYVYEMEAGEPTVYAKRLIEMLRASGVRLYVEFDDGRDDG